MCQGGACNASHKMRWMDSPQAAKWRHTASRSLSRRLPCTASLMWSCGNAVGVGGQMACFRRCVKMSTHPRNRLAWRKREMKASSEGSVGGAELSTSTGPEHTRQKNARDTSNACGKAHARKGMPRTTVKRDQRWLCAEWS